MGDQFTGEPWGFDLILRILDQTIAVGIVGMASIVTLFFTILLAISMVFLLGNLIHGRDSWPRVLYMKLFLLWFLMFVTSNWWTLITIIGEDFTQWGIVLGGNHIDLGSFYAPSGLILTCFKVIKLIWTHALNGLSIWSMESWFTFGWYMGATFCLLYAFFKMIQSVIVAIIQFKLHGAIALLFVVASIWRGSAFLATGVFGGIFSNAIKLMVLGFMTSLVTSFFSSTLWPTQPDYLTAATLAMAAWIWVWMFNQADAIAAGIINGGPSVDGSSMMSQTALTAGLGAWAATAIARLGPPGTRELAGMSSSSGSATAGAAGGGMQSLPPAFGGGGGSGGGSAGVPTGSGSDASAAGRYNARALRESAGVMESRAEDRMDMANARSNGSYDDTMYNSTVALGEKAVGYKGLFDEAVNRLDGGGTLPFPMSYDASVGAEAQRAAVVAAAGVGDTIRSMTADGRSSRQIAEALGGRLSAIDALSTRNNETGETEFNRLAAVQAYKTAENIPNPSDGAAFGTWQRAYRESQNARGGGATAGTGIPVSGAGVSSMAGAAPAVGSARSGAVSARRPNSLPYLQRYIPPSSPSSASMRADLTPED